MKYLFTIICCLFSLINDSSNLDYSEKFTFVVPDDLSIIHTWEESGVLSLNDEYGNGADLYIEEDSAHFEDKIQEIFNEWGDSIINEKISFGIAYFDLKKEANSPIDPITNIFLHRKDNYIIEAYLLNLGPASTHEEFMKQITTLLESIREKGDRDAKVWSKCSDGWADSAEFSGSQSLPAHVPTVQVR